MTITPGNLFEFLAGWDFQEPADRLQVIKNFYCSEPDSTETEYSAMDWNTVPASVREALHDECADGGRIQEFTVILKVQARDSAEAADVACELLNGGREPDAVLTCPVSFPDPDMEGQTVTL